MPNKNKTNVKPKVIILDDNELSILSYAEEFPENWERICKALDEKKKNQKKKLMLYCKNPNCFTHYLANKKIKEKAQNQGDVK